MAGGRDRNGLFLNSSEFGQIAKPSFTIVDWAEPWAAPSGSLLTLPAPTGGKGGNGVAIEAPKAKMTFEAPTSYGYEVDEIPF